MTVGSAPADKTLVAAGRKVNILWVKFSNTGTPSTAGTIELQDSDGNVLFSYRAAVAPYNPNDDEWNDFYPFFDAGEHSSLESPSGLVVNYDATVDEVLTEIGYE